MKVHPFLSPIDHTAQARVVESLSFGRTLSRRAERFVAERATKCAIIRPATAEAVYPRTLDTGGFCDAEDATALLAAYVTDRLTCFDECVVSEHALMKKTDRHVRKLGVEPRFHGGEVYYVVTQKTFHLEAVHKAIIAGASAACFRAFIIRNKPKIDESTELGREFLDELANATRAIIVDAFDSETYLICQFVETEAAPTMPPVASV